MQGRGAQLNHGATAVRKDADVLLFLHADSTLPDGFATHVTRALTHGCQWGCFMSIRMQVCVLCVVCVWCVCGVHVSPSCLQPPILGGRLVSAAVALRTRLLTLPYGDQALFVTRDAFVRCAVQLFLGQTTKGCGTGCMDSNRSLSWRTWNLCAEHDSWARWRWCPPA